MGYGGFSFIFFRDSVTENVTENVTDRKLPSHQIVLNLFKENPMRSREEMAGIMGKTVRTVQRALDKLSGEGRIRRIGTARAGYWEVIQVIVYYCSCPIIIVANSLKLYEIFSGHFLTQENHNANAFFLPNTFR